MKLANINIGTVVNHKGCYFNGELQTKYNVVLTGYVARDQSGELCLYNTKPYKEDGLWWGGDRETGLIDYLRLDKNLFPDIKWEDEEPTEVTITIR